MTDFYANSNDPANDSDLDSSVIRAEFAAIALGFSKVAGYTGNGDKLVVINSTGTGQEATNSIGFALAFTAAMTFSSTLSVLDSNLQIKDNVDATKIAQFQASGITTGTTRTYTLPDVSDTLVTLAAAQTLSTKTLTTPTINGAALSGTFSGTPTFSGAVTNSSTTTMSGSLTYGGVTLSNAVTGTGNMVLSASPTFTGTITSAAITASGAITPNGGITLGANYISRAGTSAGISIDGSNNTIFSGSLGIGIALNSWGGSWRVAQFGTRSAISQSDANDTVFSNNFYNNGASDLYITTNLASRIYTGPSGNGLVIQAAPSGTAGTVVTWTTIANLTRTSIGFDNGIAGSTATPTNITTGNNFASTSTAASQCKFFLYNDGGSSIFGIGVGGSSNILYHAGGAGAGAATKHEFYGSQAFLGGFNGALTGGATTLSVDGSGYIIRTPSDERYKNVIGELVSGIDVVRAVPAITYEFTGKMRESMGDGVFVGWGAQTVRNAALGLSVVSGTEDSVLSLNEPKMGAFLWSAMRHVDTEVESLKSWKAKAEIALAANGITIQ